MVATRGKAKTLAFSHSPSLVDGNYHGESWNFIYQVSTVKHPNFNVGDRVQLPDGRVFRFAKSGAACWTGRGCYFNNAVPAVGIDYVLLTENAPVGQAYVKTTATVAHTADDLRGGHALLKPVAASTDAVLQMRLITGNTAADAAGEITVYLDGGLTAALTTLSYIVAMPSPYTDLRYGGSTYYMSYAGIPATYVDAADKYFWVQTWGVCWIAPQGECGTSQYQRDLVFKEDGSLQHKGTTDATWLNGQRAGFILDNNAGANGLTKMLLQIDP